jgi:hypothetical protein
MPDLTAWQRCVATSVNREKGICRRRPTAQALQAIRAVRQFETLRDGKWLQSWPQRHIMLRRRRTSRADAARAFVI